jgi:hypothetical protein
VDADAPTLTIRESRRLSGGPVFSASAILQDSAVAPEHCIVLSSRLHDLSFCLLVSIL